MADEAKKKNSSQEKLAQTSSENVETDINTR